MPGTAELVLLFGRQEETSGNIAPGAASSFVRAESRLALQSPGYLQLRDDSRPFWLLSALNRDHLLARGTLPRCSYTCGASVQLGTLRLLRYPRDPE